MMNRRSRGSLIALSAISVAVVMLALLLRAQTPQPVANLDSPLPTPPPKAATATKAAPTPGLRPTSTRPPEPTPRPPSPIPTLGPPTPTPEPLPTLLPGRDIFVYTTTGERGPEIWRVQPDEMGRIVERGFQVHQLFEWNSRASISHIYSSPDGEKMAVQWGVAENSRISILDISTGQITALTSIINDKQIPTEDMLFFDWHPNGEYILMYSGNGNPDLGWRLVSVNVNTGEFETIDLIGFTMNLWIRKAVYSMDGNYLYYTHSDCFDCGSQIWQLHVDAKEKRLVAMTDRYEIATIVLSPDGQYLAYTKLPDEDYFAGYGVGELWIIPVNGGEARFLSEALTGFYREFDPAWSTDSQQIAFFSGSGSGNRLAHFSSNVYIANIKDGSSVQLSHLDGRQAANLSWAPTSQSVVFVTNQASGSYFFEPWFSDTSKYTSQPLVTESPFLLDGSKSNPILIWLPGIQKAESKQ